MDSINIKYLPALDHIRIFAACLVMVYHRILLLNGFFSSLDWFYTANPFYGLFAEGHTAVALFMVLSGFLFTTGSMGKRIDYPAFIKNRALRIYPMFLAVIAAGICFFPEEFSLGVLLRTVFLLSHQPEALSLGLVSSVFWSISIEFQFYLLFPFIVLLMQRYGVKSLFIIVLATVASRFVALMLGVDFVYITHTTLLARLDQFVLGIVAATVFFVLAHEVPEDTSNTGAGACFRHEVRLQPARRLAD